MDLAAVFEGAIVSAGIATIEQTREARGEISRLQQEKRRRVFLAELLVAKRILDGEALVRVLERARGYREEGDDGAPRLGEIAIGKGYASPLQVYESLIDQRDEVASSGKKRPLGEIMVEKCRLTPEELQDILVTAGELAARSLRSSAVARPTPRERGPLDVSQLLSPYVHATPATSVAAALDGALDTGAEAILVFANGEVQGVLSIWDARALDPELPLGSVMSRADLVLDLRSSVGDAARLLRRTEAPFLPVVSGSQVAGVLTAAALRTAGVVIERPEVELGGSD
jgi:CBS domain-containing protein